MGRRMDYAKIMRNKKHPNCSVRVMEEEKYLMKRFIPLGYEYER